MIFKDIQVKDGDITYLCEYIPYSRVSSQDKRSRDFILAFKEKDSSAIQYACNQIAPQLGDHFALAAVPSSKVVANGCSASHELIKKLIQQLPDKKIVDAGKCLVRTIDITPQHLLKGKRNPEVLLHSLEVEHPELVKNQDILVIDDITTSGNSFSTARELLLRHGARSVVGLAMGKTITDEDLQCGFIFSIDSLLETETPSSLTQCISDILSEVSFPFKVAFITQNPEAVRQTFNTDIILDRENMGNKYAHAKQLLQIYEPCIIACTDDARDIVEAKRLGMLTVYLSPKTKQHVDTEKYDYIISSLSEITSHHIVDKLDEVVQVLWK